MTSHLSRISATQRHESAVAVKLLVDTLTDADLKLPSVEVDWQAGRITGTVLVELGRATPEVVMREGLNARAQQQS